MTIIQIIMFLLANKEAIGDLLKLIQELIKNWRGDTAVAMDAATVEAMVVQYPALVEACNTEGQSFADLLKLLLENLDEISKFIEVLKGIFKPAA